MTAPLTCAELESLAPELALGGLDGPDRAAALGHVAGCPSCQHLVEDLSVVADHLLLLAPEDEPPPGFESRVLVGIAPTALRPRGWRRLGWWPLALAAAMILAASAVVMSRSADHPSQVASPTLTNEYVLALQRLGGRSLRAAPLKDGLGRNVGQAFMYDGAPSWVFVSLDTSATDGEYSVVCTGPKAGPLAWPGLWVSDGHGAAGFGTAGKVGALDQVKVVDKAGHTAYVATLDRSA